MTKNIGSPAAPGHTAQAATARPVRSRRTQAERSEDMRRRILDAAIEELTDKGYSGLRTADVAMRAGVSRGAQTHHFPSKDALIVALVEHVFLRTAELGRKRSLSVASVDESIKELMADSQDFFFSELFLIALDLAIQGRRELGSTNRVLLISAEARLPVEASWLEALIGAGVPEAVAEDLLWLSISIVRGFAVRRLWQDDAPRFQRLFRRWRQMVACYLDALPRLEPIN
ncbi:TetR/AcrR family transcriptional regulator [Hydrogenophaga sp.]|uniref:TetR/AcrR family transcriptional regulator n=1 Tax=Hydrogenophaga sp. TaxID=1904254 RepID=UPI00356B032A